MNSQGTLAVIIAHNELEHVKINVKILQGELRDSNSEIVIVDNHSDDGLDRWLMEQGRVSYIICDDKLEGYGKILEAVREQFGDDRDMLLLRANYFFTPGSVASMKSALHSREDIVAAGPVGNVFPGEQKCLLMNTYAEAIDYRNRLEEKQIETAYLDMDVMLLKGRTMGEIPVADSIPQAAMRNYMKHVRKMGGSFVIAGNAVCFCVGKTKDDAYRDFHPEIYQQEKIHQLLYSFGDAAYQGVYLYKYLASDILAGINQMNKLQNIKKSKIALTWSTDEVALSTDEEAEAAKEVIVNLPQQDVLFVSLPIRRMYHGKYVHTALETFIDSLAPEKYLDLECVESMAMDSTGSIPTRNRYAVLESAIPRIYGISDTDRKELLDFIWVNFIHPLELVLDIRFDENILRGCCLKASYLLKMREGYMRFYREVIDRVNPKVIIYSHGQDMILTYLRDTALELGIPTLEIDHGVGTVDAYHKQLVYADYLVTYSRISADLSNQQGNDRLISIGKPGVYEQTAEVKHRQSVIVISFISSLESGIFQYAENLAKRLDKDKYLVVYKAHNSEIWEESERRRIESNISNLKFLDGACDIRDCIGMSDIVVGIRSSGLFDALPFATVKIISVKDKASNFSEARPNEVLQEVINNGEIVLAENEEQLYQEVASYKRGVMYRDKINSFWPEDAADRFRALVERYL